MKDKFETGNSYGYQPRLKKHSYILYDRPISHTLKKAIDDFSGLPQASHILNLGCGDGNLEYHAFPRSFRFTSVDKDASAIAKLKTILTEQGRQDLDYASEGDVFDFPKHIKTKQLFDAAISWRVLHNLPPSSYLTLLQSVRDHMKKSGIFHISAASIFDWKAEALGNALQPQGMNNCKKVMFSDYDVERSDDFFIHFFSLEELETLAEQAGFRLIHHEYFREPSGYHHLKHHLNTYIYIRLQAI
jgi:SAM-dependent methyltransferase